MFSNFYFCLLVYARELLQYINFHFIYHVSRFRNILHYVSLPQFLYIKKLRLYVFDMCIK